MVRAEGDASPTFIHIHVTVLPTPARGALALVWANADASVHAGLGADGFITSERPWMLLFPALAAQGVGLPHLPPYLSPRHAVSGPVGATDAPSSAQCQVRLIHGLAVGLVVTERDHQRLLGADPLTALKRKKVGDVEWPDPGKS